MSEFAKNSLFTFFSSVFRFLLAVGTSVIIARILGPEGKGIYSLAVLLPSFLIVFTNFDIGQSSVYFTSRKKYSPEEIFISNFLFLVLVTFLSAIIGLAIIFFFNNLFFPNIGREYLLLAILLVPFQVFSDFTLNILLGLQKVKKYNNIITGRNLIFLLSTAILALGLCLNIKTAIMAQIFSSFVISLFLFVYLKKETKRSVPFKINLSYVKDSFKYGFKSYLGSIFSFLFLRADMFLINIFLNPLAVGLYSIGVGFTDKISLISKSAGTVLFPRIASEENSWGITPVVCRNILFITTLSAVILFFLSRYLIVSLFSEKFLESVLPLQILLIGAVAIGGSRILSYDLYGRGKPMLSTYANFAAVVVNIILNILWIPKFGISGAAWATSVSYSLAFVIKLVFYNAISGNRIKDIIFVKKSDFKFYKDIALKLLNDKHI